MIIQATPDAGHNWLNDKAYGALRGGFQESFHVSDLGAWPVWGAQRGGHRGGARACGAAGFRESGARLARGTGMMAGSGGSTVAGGPARHVPVLGRAALGALQVRDGGIYIDGTFGAGGYSRAILDAADTQVIAIDRDQSAVAGSADLVAAANGRLTVVEERFSALDKVASKFGHQQVDGVVLDIGVSSMQLDEAGRGFSFRLDGPLDMRMSGEGPSAAEVVAHASERDLADIIFQLGEERHSRAVARAIAAARKDAPIAGTRALADIVERVVHSRPGQIHPATRTFQALRMFVNEELNELAEALAAAERILKPSGRLAVVSFHSLEDRIVKTFLAERSRTAGVSRHQPEIEAETPTFALVSKRPIVADEAEIAANPRARSAKLRAAERTAAPPREFDPARFLPRLPSLDDVMRGG
jgi:16S rRNA (cytosine1402-N4)-methyltransferase